MVFAVHFPQFAIPIFHALQVKIEFASSYELSVIFRPISLVDIGHNIIFIFKLFIASATQYRRFVLSWRKAAPFGQLFWSFKVMIVSYLRKDNKSRHESNSWNGHDYSQILCSLSEVYRWPLDSPPLPWVQGGPGDPLYP